MDLVPMMGLIFEVGKFYFSDVHGNLVGDWCECSNSQTMKGNMANQEGDQLTAVFLYCWPN